MIKSSLISRIFGKFASKKFPTFFQNIINKTYVELMHLDLSDFHDYTQYDSLSALFTRALVKKRDIDKEKNSFISPCDGFITGMDVIRYGIALQIKGFAYSVEELLGAQIKDEEKNMLNYGKYINFYLSPKDYHRYHVPIDMKVQRVIHIPGKLYPVNLKWLKKIPNLFIENERVILECKNEEGRLFYMVFVGALNVGKMSFIFDKRIQTNAKKIFETYYEYGDVFLKKGDELGKFDMGSTIVMLFEKDFVDFRCEVNHKINFGEVVAVS